MKRLQLWIILAVIVVPIVMGASFFLRVVWPTTTAYVESTSPDGMYHCTVKEKSTYAQSRAVITVYRRKNLDKIVGRNLWEPFLTEPVYNDSARRSSYSVDWSFDEKHRTLGITVFGSFGSPPLDGEIIFQKRFETDSQK